LHFAAFASHFFKQTATIIVIIVLLRF